MASEFVIVASKLLDAPTIQVDRQWVCEVWDIGYRHHGLLLFCLDHLALSH